MATVRCRETNGAMWVICPVCRAGKVLKLRMGTKARNLTVYCRQCKHESVIDIGPGEGGGAGPRVTLAVYPPTPGGGQKSMPYHGATPQAVCSAAKTPRCPETA
ncbi:hypothetical protein CE91St41_01370 [Oscillospiraceae bacterium]|nr:hypothetical protein CE91St40_01370 [Oscillospiraceae bacterium]BDF73248.1 hypothetical protein CE91St41_01370 [Oscillospiraceae bacterium]